MRNSDAPPDYGAACERLARDYVERSTRFGSHDLKIKGLEAYRVQILLEDRHSVEIETEIQEIPGVIDPQGDDLSTADWDWFNQLVDEQEASERGREATLVDLSKQVEASGYASIRSRTCVRTNPRRLLHPYTCASCHGNGQVVCGSCQGSGSVSCPTCRGRGQVSCDRCHGAGRVTQHYTVRDYTNHSRTETRTEKCPHCYGGDVMCSRCVGRGRVRCDPCEGTGHVTCRNCEGHGYLTMVVSTHSFTIPSIKVTYPEGAADYISDAVASTGAASLAQCGLVTQDSTVFDLIARRVDFRYLCELDFCELRVTIGGDDSTWIIFGSPPRIHDAKGALERLLWSDFKQLTELVTWKSRLNPRFSQRAGAVITPFMESEVHQDVVAAHLAGQVPDEIAGSVNRALSADYISKSLACLRRAIGAASQWSRLKWLVGAAAASVPIAILGVIASEWSTTQSMVPGQDRLILFPSLSKSATNWGVWLIVMSAVALGWIVARWSTRRWVVKTGGKKLLEWAKQKDLLIGAWTGVAMLAVSAGTLAWTFNRWPVWMDRDGNLYGAIAVFHQATVLDSPSPGFVATPLPSSRMKSPAKRRTNPTTE